jgi:hypothetical protein
MGRLSATTKGFKRRRFQEDLMPWTRRTGLILRDFFTEWFLIDVSRVTDVNRVEELE